jgi:rare lipoprotein A
MRCHRMVILSLLSTIGYAATPTPVAAQSIAALPMPPPYAPPPPSKPGIREIVASWYGNAFAGRLTTSGEPFDPQRLTAASITVPLGSVVKVENPENGHSVQVRINDCGPYVLGRSLDLSLGAAQKVGIVRQGVARLKVTPIKIPPNADAERCSR